MKKIGYPVKVAGSKALVGCLVTSRDLPDLFAHGEDVADALLNASQALGRLIRQYKATGRAVPDASATQDGEWVVYPAPFGSQAPTPNGSDT